MAKPDWAPYDVNVLGIDPEVNLRMVCATDVEELREIEAVVIYGEVDDEGTYYASQDRFKKQSAYQARKLALRISSLCLGPATDTLRPVAFIEMNEREKAVIDLMRRRFQLEVDFFAGDDFRG